MVLKVLRRIQQPLPETPGQILLFVKSVAVLFDVHYTTHRTYGFTSHPKDEAIMVNNKCQDRDSNPHSADQKHQSLSPVHFTAWPQHATSEVQMKLKDKIVNRIPCGDNKCF